MKTLLAVLVIAGSSIALASPALADDPPPVPVTTGPHTITWTDSGNAFPVTVELDCGPACFAIHIKSTRFPEFRWVENQWRTEKGDTLTLDGVTLTNAEGSTATIS